MIRQMIIQWFIRGVVQLTVNIMLETSVRMLIIVLRPFQPLLQPFVCLIEVLNRKMF
jgi:hypothetical protein